MSVEQREGAQEHLGKRAASGFLWLAAQKWAVRASGFATLVVLTHQISPRDFGVVAAAMTVIPIVYLLSDLGFSTYLLQTDDVDQESLSTAFWTSVAAAVVLSTGLFAAAPLLAMAFRIAELETVLRVLVLAVAPTVLAGVPLSLLRRGMAFRSVAFQSLVAALVGQAVAVVLALRDGGVWALVSQLIVTQWLVAVLAWWRAGWLPSLRLSWPRLRQMAVFGVRVSSVDVVGIRAGLGGELDRHVRPRACRARPVQRRSAARLRGPRSRGGLHGSGLDDRVCSCTGLGGAAPHHLPQGTGSRVRGRSHR